MRISGGFIERSSSGGWRCRGGRACSYWNQLIPRSTAGSRRGDARATGRWLEKRLDGARGFGLVIGSPWRNDGIRRGARHDRHESTSARPSAPGAGVSDGQGKRDAGQRGDHRPGLHRAPGSGGHRRRSSTTGEVVLIRQYRHALKRYIWEIPAGTLDPGEPVMDCARRELIEETGLRGGGVARSSARSRPCPAIRTSASTSFWRRSSSAGPPGSSMPTRSWPSTACRWRRRCGMIARGEIQDAKIHLRLAAGAKTAELRTGH
ncbi:MAG: NUDIX hydrolase [Desulfobacterales bacterium]|nr:NUDIX hydrolase [Desulfobacterales bacterium]